MKLIHELEMSRQLPRAADPLIFLPVSIGSRFGLTGIIVVLVGISFMLMTMRSKNSRTSSNGLFLLLATVCWGAVFTDGGLSINCCLLMLVAMYICSAVCFIEASFLIGSDNPEAHLDTTRLYASSIASVIVVVATNLCWATNGMLTQT